jgi:SAM-dependent methyltransferase
MQEEGLRSTKWEEIWDRIWAQQGPVTRFVTTGRESYNLLLRRVLLRYVSPATEFLELGCGTATLTLSLAGCISRLVGLDISDEALLLARNQQRRLKVRNAEFVKGDCRDVPYTERFDLVWSAGLIEHFFDQDIAIVQQHLKALKPGGVVLMSVPYAYSLHRLHYVLTRPILLRRFWPWSDVRHFQRFYTHDDLKRLGQRTGYPFRVFLLPPSFLGFFLGIILLEVRKPPTVFSRETPSSPNRTV